MKFKIDLHECLNRLLMLADTHKNFEDKEKILTKFLSSLAHTLKYQNVNY